MNFLCLLKEDERKHFRKEIQEHNLRLINRTLLQLKAIPLSDEGYVEGVVTECNDDFDWTRVLLFDPKDGIIPTLPKMFKGVAELFDKLGSTTGLARPRGDNAERNYFARCLIRFFRDNYGKPSPTIVAGITAAFFSKSPITEDEVKQLAKKLPAGLQTRYSG